MILFSVMYSFGVIFPPVIAMLHYFHLDPEAAAAPGDNQEAESVSKPSCQRQRNWLGMQRELQGKNPNR